MNTMIVAPNNKTGYSGKGQFCFGILFMALMLIVLPATASWAAVEPSAGAIFYNAYQTFKSLIQGASIFIIIIEILALYWVISHGELKGAMFKGIAIGLVLFVFSIAVALGAIV